jgi:hypothetical protein
MGCKEFWMEQHEVVIITTPPPLIPWSTLQDKASDLPIEHSGQ